MQHYQEDQDEWECAGCGKPQSQWQGEKGKGVTSVKGELYCCNGCMDGERCNCETDFDAQIAENAG